MHLKDLPHLLYTAHRRYTSVQVRWTYRYSRTVMRIALERWEKMEGGGNAAGFLMSLEASTDENTSSGIVQKQMDGVRRQVWWQKPSCWREERTWEHTSDTLTILCDEQWWLFSKNHLTTNAADADRWSQAGIHVKKSMVPNEISSHTFNVPLLDPSFLLATHELEPVSETVHAGRPAIEVRGTWEKRIDTLHEAYFWATADEYRLLVDQEYGILLRYAAVIDGEEYAVSSVEEVVYDQPIPPETFVFSPPSKS